MPWGPGKSCPPFGRRCQPSICNCDVTGCVSWVHRLSILNISGSQTTDVGVDSIVRSCTRLRELNLSKCVEITNRAVSNIANNITCIYSLNLDGNPNIAPKVVNSYVTNRKLLFAEMGQLWLGMCTIAVSSRQRNILTQNYPWPFRLSAQG